MKHLTFLIIISVLVILFSGCSSPCFYQAGKSIEQSERDLLECAYSDRSTSSCMRDRGYQYVDTNSLPRNSNRKKIVVLFQESADSGGRKAMPEEYWIADGLDMSSENFKLLSDSYQTAEPKKPPRKLVGYRARKNASGELMKDATGNFIFVPVYEDELEE